MNLIALLQPFWQICLLRRGPQSLPASYGLLGVLLLLHVALGATLEFLSPASGRPLLGALLSTFAMLVMVSMLLQLTGFGRRLLQTLSAVAGCDLVIGALLLPLFAIATPEPPLAVLLVLAWFGLLLWNLTITAHILRCAIEVPFWVALVIAIGMVALLFGVVGPVAAG